MTITGLGLVADDLTGALDAAAPFATPARPVRLPWRIPVTAGTRIAVSTESRHLPADRAAAAVAAAVARLRPVLPGAGTLWFKKVDSVLRGQPLAETVAMARACGLSTCIFAPAFPAMGRITRDGRHLVRSADGRWEATPHGDLSGAFAALSRDLLPEIVVVNAETRADLRQSTEAWRHRHDILWAGSRGLAEAIAGGCKPLAAPGVGLFVIGTDHPVTRQQVRALQGIAVDAGDGPIIPRPGAPLLLDPVQAAATPAQTRTRLAQALREARPPPDGAAVLVTGGDTLTIVLDATGATALDCIGEIAPGLPVSRIAGGRWDAATLISKSGGFGSGTTLRDLVAAPG